MTVVDAGDRQVGEDHQLRDALIELDRLRQFLVDVGQQRLGRALLSRRRFALAHAHLFGELGRIRDHDARQVHGRRAVILQDEVDPLFGFDVAAALRPPWPPVHHRNTRARQRGNCDIRASGSQEVGLLDGRRAFRRHHADLVDRQIQRRLHT